MAVPRTHPWADRPAIRARELKSETMLLKGIGPLLRDHILEVSREGPRVSSA